MICDAIFELNTLYAYILVDGSMFFSCCHACFLPTGHEKSYYVYQRHENLYMQPDMIHYSGNYLNKPFHFKPIFYLTKLSIVKGRVTFVLNSCMFSMAVRENICLL